MDEKQMMDPELGRSLGRIEGKMDMLLNSIRDTDRRADALEARLRVIENYRSKVAGVSAAVGTAAGVVSTVLFNMFAA